MLLTISMLLLLLESAQPPHPRTQIYPNGDLHLREERRLTSGPWCVSGVTEFPRILLWAAPVCVRVRTGEREECETVVCAVAVGLASGLSCREIGGMRAGERNRGREGFMLLTIGLAPGLLSV